ncbi:MAG: 50S ribosomal protein L9 [Flavobacteriales bacterium]|nr:50S ribosomal protein L9 [Flavobacteriales bacterium]|tara:strand:+ start:601 stop:1044 length:444 start_codon:yes stop_codon:yes gene_type:complete
MKVILLENIENLGFKDEVVNVKNGYGRNYLIPEGKAILATSSAIKILEEKLKQQNQKEEKNISDANNVAEKLKQLNIQIKAKVSTGSKLFGKITLAQFMSQLDNKLEEKIDKSFVNIPSAKELGKYEARIRLHRSVDVTVPFDVISE